LRVRGALERGGTDVAVLVDRDFTIVWASPSAADVLGWHPDSVVGRSAIDLVHPDDLERAVEALAELTVAGELYDPIGGVGLDPSRFTGTVVRLLRADGSSVMVDVRANSMLDVPDVDGVLLVLRDCSDRAATDRLLELVAADASLDVVVPALIETVEAHLRGSRATVYLPGDRMPSPPPGAEPSGLRVAAAVLRCMASSEFVSVDLYDGDYRCVWLIPVTGPHSSDPVAVVGVWHLVEQPLLVWIVDAIRRLARVTSIALASQHEAEAMRRAATLDPLTGLMNRRSLEAVLTGLGSDPSRRPCAVAFFDLDHFKPINDALGHATGDQVLITVAERLRRAVRPNDLVARWGGDEFVVLLRDVVDEDEADQIAERMSLALSEPIGVSGTEVVVTASVGVAFASAGVELDGLIHAADMEMYAEKKTRSRA
jgi:diguanylate cyclase (GGDEF)-like protein/PAS domain S-box-containing protein